MSRLKRDLGLDPDTFSSTQHRRYSIDANSHITWETAEPTTLLGRRQFIAHADARLRQIFNLLLDSTPAPTILESLDEELEAIYAYTYRVESDSLGDGAEVYYLLLDIRLRIDRYQRRVSSLWHQHHWLRLFGVCDVHAMRTRCD